MTYDSSWELVLIGIAAFLYLVNLWHAIRIFTNVPEIISLRVTSLIAAGGVVIPFLGVLWGLWYLAFGPTRARSEKRINTFLLSADATTMASWIDNQITSAHLWDQEWIKSTWLALPNTERVSLIEKNIDTYRRHVRESLLTYRHSTRTIESDFVAALRKTLS